MADRDIKELDDRRRAAVVLPIGTALLDGECHAASHVIPAGELHGAHAFYAQQGLSTGADTSVSLASDAQVVFEAGQSIALRPGFTVQPGGLFHARIGPVSCWVVPSAE